MSSYNLPPAERIVVKNGNANKAEPGVSVVSEDIPSGEIFGGVMKRAVMGAAAFPLSNDNLYVFRLLALD
ncbi:hypothetical protein FNE72_29045 [Klebsiella pneumoniae]|nr:hypothetical protein FNE72_29045 [Klebsiella pneumoniae]